MHGNKINDLAGGFATRRRRGGIRTPAGARVYWLCGVRLRCCVDSGPLTSDFNNAQYSNQTGRDTIRAHKRETTMTKTTKPRMPGIQGLRGLAAMAVLIQHVTFYVCQANGTNFSDYLKVDLGSFGVELFFVISGFVMVGCMGQGSRFMWNRVIRIYPGYWLSLIAACGLLSWFAPWQWSAISLTLLPTTNLNPTYYVPYWTLIYEMAFYAATFGMILVGKDRAPALCLGWLAAVLLVAQYYPVEVLAPGYQVLASKMCVYFIAGMIAAIYRPSLAAVPKPLLGVLCAGLWAAGMGMGQISLMAHHLLLALCYAGAVVALADVERFRSAQVFGDLSFGVYLIHVPVLLATLEVMRRVAPDVTGLVQWLVVLAVTLIVSTVFGWVEHTLYARLFRGGSAAKTAPLTSPV